MSVTLGAVVLVTQYPMKTLSELNRRDHWRTKHERTKQQKEAAWGHTKALAGLLSLVAKKAPITITLTRLRPTTGRDLDTDNLASAFKATRDGVALALGIDDGSKRLTWVYGQELAGESCVRIEISSGGVS